MKAVSLFSGCGGFDWGAKQAGVQVIWANDNDPSAAAAYRSLFPEVPFHEQDIRTVAEFPRADILIGCYPCTGFSVAARRRAVGAQERDLRAAQGNFLYREFIRALPQVQPRYLFVENVRGMLSAEQGWFFRQQLTDFKRHGYRIRFARLCASEFGVPQTRERVFIVGIRRDVREFRYRFPQPTHGPRGRLPFRVLRDAINGFPDWPDGEYLVRDFHGHYLTRNRKRRWGELSYTVVAHSHHVPLHPLGEPMAYVAKDRWRLQGEANRRLSWRECAAIQGLSPGLAPSGSLHAKYRVVGNAVPPAFGKALLQPVVKFECE